MTITSFQNSLVKRIKRLKQKKYRLRDGAFFVDGLRLVASALEAGADVEQIVYCDELLTSVFGRSLLEKAESVSVSADIFHTLSERDNPAGIGAIVRKWRVESEEWGVKENGVYVALVGASDPGNVGTIIRTVDAAGADGVILVGNTVDVTHPNVVKASMGAYFAVDMIAMDEDAFAAWARDVRLVATSAKGSADYRAADYSTPIVLLMGSEREGLSDRWIDAADQLVTIPMAGVSSSLNLAVATGLLLYETKR